MRISPRFYGLPSEEIGRLVEEAARYAEQDQGRRQDIEAGIKADNMVRAARRTIDEGGADVDISLVEEAERGILQVQTALASGDSQEIKSKTEELEKLVKALYRQAKDRKREQERLAFAKPGVRR